MPRIKIIYITGILLLLSTALPAQTMTVRQYIDSFKNIAMREMIEFKVPASITLAQGLLESGSGNSRLAKQGNNHFGIKCKKDWTGCTILEDDDDLQECFRCYANAEESFKDHSRFLHDNKRYAELFKLDIRDYKGWAAGLLAAGYATNKKYADLLIGSIERNQLAVFDSLVVSGYNPYNQQIPANIDIVNPKQIPVTVVQPNQNTAVIASENHITEKRLIKNNDLAFHTITPGDVLYLKPKKKKASVASHTVSEGETMWLISQKYAIKLNSLYKKNQMDPGTEAMPGSVLHLRDKAEQRPDTGRIHKEEKKADIARNDSGEKYHIVAGGETLYSICRLYGISLDELKKSNNLQTEQIIPGQKLIIKKSSVTEKTTKTIVHEVKQGDTLYGIAKSYGVTVDSIKQWNQLSSDGLKLGQKLTIYK